VAEKKPQRAQRAAEVLNILCGPLAMLAHRCLRFPIHNFNIPYLAGVEKFSIQMGDRGAIAGSCYGDGRRLIVCWHGYGQSRKLFVPLLDAMPAGSRVVLLDMPLFGESAWADDGLGISPADLDAFLRLLLARFPADSVECIAFSLGAKIALGLYEATSVPIRRMVLISPDGLRIHPLYRFCIYNPVGKVLFYTVLRWPAFFLFILKAMYHLRITDAFKYRFVSRQFDAPHKRDLLRRVWQGFSRIRPDIDRIAARAGHENTDWHVIWGEADNVLPMKLCRDFIQKVNGAKLHVVPGGHFLLNPPTAEVMTLLKSILNS
jgi:pimeloyl-ACP methyl ester carboxylesterase